jgi:hypothetical protein
VLVMHCGANLFRLGRSGAFELAVRGAGPFAAIPAL